MIIIAHRGYWNEVEEKNREIAFERALNNGFGIETDVRDYCGELVVSHDIPNGNEMRFDDFLKIYGDGFSEDNPLAINIKADGLVKEIELLINKYKIKYYFVFDMSIPDTLPYIKSGLSVFIRESEYERHDNLHNQCNGIWVDELEAPWITRKKIEELLVKGTSVCIVSPELHGRDYKSAWKTYKNIAENEQMMICTDFPVKCREFYEN